MSAQGVGPAPRTCLHWAAHNGHLDIVDLLLLTSMVRVHTLSSHVALCCD